MNEDVYDLQHSPTNFQVVGSSGTEGFGSMRDIGGFRNTMDVSYSSDGLDLGGAKKGGAGSYKRKSDGFDRGMA